MECQHRFITFEVSDEDFDRYMHQEAKRFSEGEIHTMVLLREQGFTHSKIAERLGRTKQSVDLKMFRLLTSEEYFLILKDLEASGSISNFKTGM
jgi:hypothetical protein